MNRLRLERLPMDPIALPSVFFLVLLLAIGTLGSPVFLSPTNVSNILVQVTPLLLIAVGQTFVIGSRGLDLSVGATATFAATLAATLYPVVGMPAIPLALAASVLVGLANGVGVAAGLNPFLMTLASLSVVQGLIFTYRTSPGGAIPSELAAVATLIGPMPLALPIVLAVVAIAAFVLRRTRLGAHILASGGDPVVARLAGVRLTRSLVSAYVICALLAGLAGLFLAARTRTGDPLIGQGFTLDSITAVVLGGTLLAGGRVTLFGTVIGSVCLGLLPNVLNLLDVPYYWQLPLTGALLIGAVLLPSIGRQLRERRQRARMGEELLRRAGKLTAT